MLQTTTQGSFSAKLSPSNHPPVKKAYSLGRYKEEIASFDQAIKLQT